MWFDSRWGAFLHSRRYQLTVSPSRRIFSVAAPQAAAAYAPSANSDAFSVLAISHKPLPVALSIALENVETSPHVAAQVLTRIRRKSATGKRAHQLANPALLLLVERAVIRLRELSNVRSGASRSLSSGTIDFILGRSLGIFAATALADDSPPRLRLLCAAASRLACDMVAVSRSNKSWGPSMIFSALVPWGSVGLPHGFIRKLLLSPPLDATAEPMEEGEDASIIDLSDWSGQQLAGVSHALYRLISSTSDSTLPSPQLFQPHQQLLLRELCEEETCWGSENRASSSEFDVLLGIDVDRPGAHGDIDEDDWISSVQLPCLPTAEELTAVESEQSLRARVQTLLSTPQIVRGDSRRHTSMSTYELREISRGFALACVREIHMRATAVSSATGENSGASQRSSELGSHAPTAVSSAASASIISSFVPSTFTTSHALLSNMDVNSTALCLWSVCRILSLVLHTPSSGDSPAAPGVVIGGDVAAAPGGGSFDVDASAAPSVLAPLLDIAHVPNHNADPLGALWKGVSWAMLERPAALMSAAPKSIASLSLAFASLPDESVRLAAGNALIHCVCTALPTDGLKLSAGAWSIRDAAALLGSLSGLRGVATLGNQIRVPPPLASAANNPSMHPLPVVVPARLTARPPSASRSGGTITNFNLSSGPGSAVTTTHSADGDARPLATAVQLLVNVIRDRLSATPFHADNGVHSLSLAVRALAELDTPSPSLALAIEDAALLQLASQPERLFLCEDADEPSRFSQFSTLLRVMTRSGMGVNRLFESGAQSIAASSAAGTDGEHLFLREADLQALSHLLDAFAISGLDGAQPSYTGGFIRACAQCAVRLLEESVTRPLAVAGDGVAITPTGVSEFIDAISHSCLIAHSLALLNGCTVSSESMSRLISVLDAALGRLQLAHSDADASPVHARDLALLSTANDVCTLHNLREQRQSVSVLSPTVEAVVHIAAVAAARSEQQQQWPPSLPMARMSSLYYSSAVTRASEDELVSSIAAGLQSLHLKRPDAIPLFDMPPTATPHRDLLSQQRRLVTPIGWSQLPPGHRVVVLEVDPPTAFLPLPAAEQESVVRPESVMPAAAAADSHLSDSVASASALRNGETNHNPDTFDDSEEQGAKGIADAPAAATSPYALPPQLRVSPGMLVSCKPSPATCTRRMLLSATGAIVVNISCFEWDLLQGQQVEEAFKRPRGGAADLMPTEQYLFDLLAPVLLHERR